MNVVSYFTSRTLQQTSARCRSGQDEKKKEVWSVLSFLPSRQRQQLVVSLLSRREHPPLQVLNLFLWQVLHEKSFKTNSFSLKGKKDILLFRFQTKSLRWRHIILIWFKNYGSMYVLRRKNELGSLCLHFYNRNIEKRFPNFRR